MHKWKVISFENKFLKIFLKSLNIIFFLQIPLELSILQMVCGQIVKFLQFRLSPRGYKFKMETYHCDNVGLWTYFFPLSQNNYSLAKTYN